MSESNMEIATRQLRACIAERAAARRALVAARDRAADAEAEASRHASEYQRLRDREIELENLVVRLVRGDAK